MNEKTLTERDVSLHEHDLNAGNFINVNTGNPLRPMDEDRRKLCVRRFIRTFGDSNCRE